MQTLKRGQLMSATKAMVLRAVFAALALAVTTVFRFKIADFLTFDLKDAVITIAGLLMGPVTALSIALLVPLLESVVTGFDTGIYGLIMNTASSLTFAFSASMVYQYRKRLSGAIIGLACSVVALLAVMMAMNLLVTPIYQGVPRQAVLDMIPVLLLPFNFVKAMANAALVLVLYKPVSRAVSATRLLPHRIHKPVSSGMAVLADKKSRLWISLAVTLAGVFILAAAVCYFILGLGGEIEWLRR